MKSMDFFVRLGAHPQPHLLCGKGGQRRLAEKDAISCGRICEAGYLGPQQAAELVGAEEGSAMHGLSGSVQPRETDGQLPQLFTGGR